MRFRVAIAVVGVPENIPVDGASVIPGVVGFTVNNLYGGVPPDPTKRNEYGNPTVAGGMDFDKNKNGVGGGGVLPPPEEN